MYQNVSLMPRNIFMPSTSVTPEAPPLSEILTWAADPPVPSRLPLR